MYGRTKTEARRKIREIAERSQAGVALRDEREALGLYLDRWGRTTLAASSRRPTTQETYRTLLRTQVVPVLGEHRLDQLRPSHIDELVLAMRTAGKSAATIRQTYAVLRMALDDAVRDGLLVRNPAAAVARPKVARTDAAVLTVEQVQAVLAASVGTRIRPVLVVLAATGLRRGEALGLRWSDVDLDAGQARVAGSLVRVGTDLVVQPPKTDRGAARCRCRRRSSPSCEPIALGRSRRGSRPGRRGPAWTGSSRPRSARPWIPGTS